MFVKPFDYVRATTPRQACDALARLPGSKLLAGGQSLMPMINLGLVTPTALVDISRIKGLSFIRQERNELAIGALTTHHQLESSQLLSACQPLLAAAVGHIGHPRVRTWGTLGGSLAHGDPVAELPLVMAVAEARYEITDGHQTRVCAAQEFGLGYFSTQLEDNELLSTIRVPILAPGWGWGFHEFSRRPGDFALIAVACLLQSVEGRVVQMRLGLAGVADRPVRCDRFEAAAIGVRGQDLDQLSDQISTDLSPNGDHLASAAYRCHLARVLGTRAVEDAWRRAIGQAA